MGRPEYDGKLRSGVNELRLMPLQALSCGITAVTRPLLGWVGGPKQTEQTLL